MKQISLINYTSSDTGEHNTKQIIGFSSDKMEQWEMAELIHEDDRLHLHWRLAQ